MSDTIITCWKCDGATELSDSEDGDGFLYLELYCEKCNAYMEIEAEAEADGRISNAFWRSGASGEAQQWRTLSGFKNIDFDAMRRAALRGAK
jgi:hypothetical protein